MLLLAKQLELYSLPLGNNVIALATIQAQFKHVPCVSQKQFITEKTRNQRARRKEGNDAKSR